MSRVVLKLGGRVAADAAATALALREEGHDVVVVHGAGPQITSEMERRGIVPAFVDGRRATTPEVLEVVRDSFASVNAEVCAAIGEAAVPLFGDEAHDAVGGNGRDGASALHDDEAHVVYSALMRT